MESLFEEYPAFNFYKAMAFAFQAQGEAEKHLPKVLNELTRKICLISVAFLDVLFETENPKKH
jgi:hypothetical protein